MRVFVAGATGVIGQYLVPGLISDGHEVTGSTSSLGVKPPMHAPAWLGRLLGGEMTVAMMTEVRGASNEKARRELGWTPGYPSWRDGFPAWAEAFKSGRAA